MSTLNRPSRPAVLADPDPVTPFQPLFDAMSRMLSPHDLNPLNVNPLKDLIVRLSISTR